MSVEASENQLVGSINFEVEASNLGTALFNPNEAFLKKYDDFMRSQKSEIQAIADEGKVIMEELENLIKEVNLAGLTSHEALQEAMNLRARLESIYSSVYRPSIRIRTENQDGQNDVEEVVVLAGNDEGNETSES